MNELRIDPRWKWAAMDKDGRWFFYDAMPSGTSEHSWIESGAAGVAAVFSLNKHIDWRDSLHEIVHEGGRAYLRKHVDVPGDGEPVMVRDRHGWHPRYSAGKFTDDGMLLCYHSGGTKWSSGGDIAPWTEWRRPTPEELEG